MVKKGLLILLLLFLTKMEAHDFSLRKMKKAGLSLRLSLESIQHSTFKVQNSIAYPILNAQWSILNSRSGPNPILNSFKKKAAEKKKLIAAALALPLPFGILGLHRIYLGTKPFIPLVYIVTLGGGFGILPFIDFCVLLLDKDISRYGNNSHIFMWIENENKKDTLK